MSKKKGAPTTAYKEKTTAQQLENSLGYHRWRELAEEYIQERLNMSLNKFLETVWDYQTPTAAFANGIGPHDYIDRLLERELAKHS